MAAPVNGLEESSTWPHASGPRNALTDAELNTTYGF